MEGPLSKIALAVMFTFFIISILATTYYDASPDTGKVAFTNHTQYRNWSELNEENFTYADNGESVSNMQLAAEAIGNTIAEAKADMDSNSITGALEAAFGLTAVLGVNILALLFAILLDGVNFIGGVALNLGSLPTPWNYFANLMGFAVALFIVYTVLSIVGAALKWKL